MKNDPYFKLVAFIVIVGAVVTLLAPARPPQTEPATIAARQVQ